MHVYKTKYLERILGIPASAIRSLVRAGHIEAQRGDRGRRGYTFQDLIVMRTASALRAAGISGHKVNRVLRDLRARLPPRMPLSSVAILGAGERIVVRKGSHTWDADTGQYLLPLQPETDTGGVRLIGDRDDERARADDYFNQAYVAEADDRAGAVAAYERCLQLRPDYREARINLGRLFHVGGRLDEAEKIYRGAVEKDCDTLFNLGVVLEDLGRESDAITAYGEALSLDPNCADAHYNLARLYEGAGRARESMRHLLAYRRLSR
jgi:tetratricopeptide (TPR) repeat protein